MCARTLQTGHESNKVILMGIIGKVIHKAFLIVWCQIGTLLWPDRVVSDLTNVKNFIQAACKNWAEVQNFLVLFLVSKLLDFHAKKRAGGHLSTYWFLSQRCQTVHSLKYCSSVAMPLDEYSLIAPFVNDHISSKNSTRFTRNTQSIAIHTAPSPQAKDGKSHQHH